MHSVYACVPRERALIHAAVLLFSLLLLTAAVGATTVKIEPQQQVLLPGETFSFTVQVVDVTNMSADQAFVLFEPTAIELTSIQTGPFLSSGGNTLPITKIDNANGTAYFAEALLNGAVSGSGVLAIIEATTRTSQAGTFTLTLDSVMLADDRGAVIPVETRHGSVTLDSEAAFVITINSPQHKTYASTAIRLEFTLEPANASPAWIAYCLDGAENVTIAGTTTIPDLPAGLHAIVLYAGDSNGNILQSPTVFFTVHPGDILPDGEVDIFDLQRLAWAFLAQPLDTHWNEAADLNCDNTINLFDLQLLAWNFGNVYTV